MSAPVTTAVALTCHPATPCGAVHGIEAQVRRDGDAILSLRYALAGDPDRLCIPAQRTPHRAERLWQHTCFELFCAAAKAPEYCEVNLSPSGEWAMYRFDAYREGMRPVETQRPPRISVQRRSGGLQLDASVDLAGWYAPPEDPALTLALAAVIEEEDGRLSYWALAHPGAQPDFHHAGGFVLALPRAASPPAGSA